MRYAVTAAILAGLCWPAGPAWADGEAPPAPAKPAPKVKVLSRPQSGWLGIRTALVPEALAWHLNLKRGTGVIVRNVVADGPADAAGVQRYDVLVRLNGDAVNLTNLAAALRKFKPGEKITLGLVQKGRSRDVTIVLGKPMTVAQARMKYQEQPQTVWKDRLRYQGGVVRGVPPQWRAQVGGRPSPQDLAQVLQRSHAGQWQLEVELGADGKANSWTMRRQRNGQTVEVRRLADGRITVRKVSLGKDGKADVLTRTHADAAALKKADPDTYRVFEAMDPTRMSEGSAAAKPAAVKKAKAIPEAYRRHAERFREELQRNIDRQVDRELSLLQKHLQADSERGSAALTAEEAGRMQEAMKAMLRPGGRHAAVREFRLAPDGRIEVRLQTGDDASVMTFKDAADLRTRQPELHKRFVALQTDLAR